MKVLQRYVPKQKYNVTYHLAEEFVAQEDCYHHILFGGDQLTVCRARGVQSARFHEDESEERFEGLLPVTEDWHARMTLMRVSLKYYLGYDLMIYFHRLFGVTFFQRSHLLRKGHFISLKNLLVYQMTQVIT